MRLGLGVGQWSQESCESGGGVLLSEVRLHPRIRIFKNKKNERHLERCLAPDRTHSNQEPNGLYQISGCLTRSC